MQVGTRVGENLGGGVGTKCWGKTVKRQAKSLRQKKEEKNSGIYVIHCEGRGGKIRERKKIAILMGNAAGDEDCTFLGWRSEESSLLRGGGPHSGRACGRGREAFSTGKQRRGSVSYYYLFKKDKKMRETEKGKSQILEDTAGEIRAREDEYSSDCGRAFDILKAKRVRL